jgi:hypothetical protein
MISVGDYFKHHLHEAKNQCVFCGTVPTLENRNKNMLWCQGCKTTKKTDNHFACCAQCYDAIPDKEQNLGLFDMLRKDFPALPESELLKGSNSGFDFTTLHDFFKENGAGYFRFHDPAHVNLIVPIMREEKMWQAIYDTYHKYKKTPGVYTQILQRKHDDVERWVVSGKKDAVDALYEKQKVDRDNLKKSQREQEKQYAKLLPEIKAEYFKLTGREPAPYVPPVGSEKPAAKPTRPRAKRCPRCDGLCICPDPFVGGSCAGSGDEGGSEGGDFTRRGRGREQTPGTADAAPAPRASTSVATAFAAAPGGAAASGGEGAAMQVDPPTASAPTAPAAAASPSAAAAYRRPRGGSAAACRSGEADGLAAAAAAQACSAKPTAPPPDTLASGDEGTAMQVDPPAATAAAAAAGFRAGVAFAADADAADATPPMNVEQSLDEMEAAVEEEEQEEADDNDQEEEAGDNNQEKEEGGEEEEEEEEEESDDA